MAHGHAPATVRLSFPAPAGCVLLPQACQIARALNFSTDWLYGSERSTFWGLSDDATCQTVKNRICRVEIRGIPKRNVATAGRNGDLAQSQRT